ncbi:Probable small nuclear ribonucleoprotein E (snRNP-E) (Sm protein E) (Sm-E) (SmE) [Durusdinium trenchii]|uniref:Sm protein E n=1 Tax=Durusdinium trenchii TaxID=1381693 RepID=A0ABP0SRG6_9DINO
MAGVVDGLSPETGRIDEAHLLQKYRRNARIANLIRSSSDAKLRQAIAACGRDWQQALALLEGARRGALRLQILGFNAAMRCCERAGQWQLAVDLSDQFQKEGITLNKFANEILLTAGGISGRWSLALEKLWTLCACAEEEVFEAPDHVTFNCAISACARGDSAAWHAAVSVFAGLRKQSVQPSDVTFNASSSACASAAAWRAAMSFLEQLEDPRGRTSGPSVAGTRLAGELLEDEQRNLQLAQLVSVGEVAQLEESFRNTGQAGRNRLNSMVNRWAPSINQAVVSCAEVSVWQPALLAVANAAQCGLFSPTIYTYNSLATACLRCHAWSWGLLLLGDARSKGLRLDAFSAASAFSSCQTEKQWQVTSKILQSLRVGEDEGVALDLVVASSAMTSFEKGDRWQDAIVLFVSSALQARLSHNVVSCSSAITACEAGDWWPGAFALLQQMGTAALRPNAVSYQAALSSTKETWRCALSSFRFMEREGIKWTVLGCEHVIRACEHRGELGVVRQLLELVRKKPGTEDAKATLKWTLPINQIFRYLQNRSRVQVWLHEQADLRIEGRILGFDEYMNLVIDDAEEIMVKKKTRRAIGRILLKGDNICLMMNTGA